MIVRLLLLCHLFNFLVKNAKNLQEVGVFEHENDEKRRKITWENDGKLHGNRRILPIKTSVKNGEKRLLTFKKDREKMRKR